MKRITTIFILLLLLFNAFGYYLLFSYEQVQAHRVTLETVPNSSFKVIKMLVSVYADIEDREFEYVDGSFFYEGKAYTIVKKRIKNDSLELYCLNNMREDQLNTQLGDFLNQNIISGKNSGNQPAKKILKQYYKRYINPVTNILVVYPKIMEEVFCVFVFKDAMTRKSLSPPSPPPNFV
ncbi:MAG: hypothetical protein JNL70_14095 [Saprospiraceae bacterium]|nr:hypothetical protein [Saprospiraceae bacterium]